VIKFPNSSLFEIELPEDINNVVSVRLTNWTFPANYSTFSETFNNLTMSFQITNPYNPAVHLVSDPMLEAIYQCLFTTQSEKYDITIEEGFYTPSQMVTELTNKFNESITNYILKFFNDNEIEYATAKSLFKQYDRFNIVYNTVQQKIWFGNSADKFTLTNDSSLFFKSDFIDPRCIKKRILPDFSSWGLPGYLGFARCPATSDSGTNLIGDPSLSTEFNVPRFYYGEVVTNSGDNGYWLLPGAPNATVYFLQAPLKISFMGPAYIYMEVEGMNCIDESSPWNLSEYTAHTNRTNGIVNSSFAKIPVPTTPISQWFDNDMGPYKYWNPPAERLGKFKFKFRYHNGQLVDFGQFDYSFMIEFNLLKPQPERSYSIRNAFDLAQTQSFGSKFI
jgi:hypothetical protein